MSVLGYSEMVKELYGITPDTVREELKILLRAKPSEARINLLKILARVEKGTVSELLRHAGMNNTGGSYKVVRGFFEELCALKILKSLTVGRRTYYHFVKGSSLKTWLEKD